METYNRFKKDLNNLVLFIAVIFILSDIIVWMFNVGYDNTDDILNNKRSGVSLHTDYATGCQYLGGHGGGLTPRLNKDGIHLCDTK